MRKRATLYAKAYTLVHAKRAAPGGEFSKWAAEATPSKQTAHEMMYGESTLAKSVRRACAHAHKIRQSPKDIPSQKRTNHVSKHGTDMQTCTGVCETPTARAQRSKRICTAGGMLDDTRSPKAVGTCPNPLPHTPLEFPSPREQ